MVPAFASRPVCPYPMRWLAAVAVCAGAVGGWSRAPGLAADFRVGAAAGDVTPAEPTPMWGFGSRHARLSEGVLEPLAAKALVIAVGDEKLAIVGLDLGRSPAEPALQRIRDAIRTQAGIGHSLIAGSHTHNAPVLELSDEPGRGRGRFDATLRYYAEMEKAIVETILAADAALTPAHVAVGAVELPNFNRNRHSKVEPIPVDRRLAVLRFDRADTGQPIAVLVNFAAHPTSIPEDLMLFSPDYVGALRRQLEEEVGGVAVFMQGASGDLSTNRGPFGDHEKYGEALGRQAVALAKSLEPRPVPAPSLQVREERFPFTSRTNFKNPAVQAMFSLAFFPELVANYVAEFTDGISPRLTVAVLNGDIALVGGSGEFFCQHALRLRERARIGQVMFFGYCNGYHQYFPTIQGAAEGGYGGDAQVAPAEVGAGERMMDTALIWIYEMLGRL